MTDSERIPIGTDLDATVCKYVFGMSAARIRWLKWSGLMPKFSWDHKAARKVVDRLYDLVGDERESAILRRYNDAMNRYGTSWRGALGMTVILGCPANICEAAIFAVRG